jgi:hypothetical protein
MKYAPYDLTPMRYTLYDTPKVVARLPWSSLSGEAPLELESEDNMVDFLPDTSDGSDTPDGDQAEENPF